MSAKILIVDDDPDVLEVLAFDLKVKGYVVKEATSGQAALRALEDDPVDLVLSDVRMPDGDGFWLLSELRRRASKVPVMLLSGTAISAEKLRELDGQGVLTKPYGLADLHSMIDKLLAPQGTV